MGFGNIAWLADSFTFLDSAFLLFFFLTGCWVESRVAISALVLANFHSKESITLYFFDVKDLIYTYVNRVTKCCSEYIALIA